MAGQDTLDNMQMVDMAGMVMVMEGMVIMVTVGMDMLDKELIIHMVVTEGKGMLMEQLINGEDIITMNLGNSDNLVHILTHAMLLLMVQH